MLLFQFPCLVPAVESQLNKNKPGVVNIVFKSADGGQTWLDISKGLPEHSADDVFFANKSGLWLRSGKATYHSKPTAAVSVWQKEIFPDKWTSIADGKNGLFAYNYRGQIVHKLNGSSVWSPVYTNFQGNIRTVFETAAGVVFIGSDDGLYRSANNGKTWKQVDAGGWVIKMVEQQGVLVATSQSGIIQSADGGESWSVVISEGGVGIDVAGIQGGFAAITYNTMSKTRRVRTSYDGGKTWQAIDAGLPPSLSVASVIQVGEYFFCSHPAGIFRSADKAKTWKLLLPAVDNKVFNLSVSGNVIYAIPVDGGC